MIDMLVALGYAIAGVFVAIMLGGIMSGLVTFGLIEFLFRRLIQKATVIEFVERPVRSALNKRGKDGEMPWILRRRRYSSRSFEPGPDQDRFRRWRAEYMRALEAVWLREGKLVPTLLGIPAAAAYALHGRQLCGQVAARLNRESMEGSGAQFVATPAIDTLLMAKFVLEDERKFPLVAPMSRAEEQDEAARVLALSRQADAEQAMSMVDVMQIEMANAVKGWAFLFSAIIVVFMFSAVLLSASTYLNPADASGGFVVQVLGGLAGIVLAFVTIALIAGAACVIAMLTFNMADRFATAR